MEVPAIYGTKNGLFAVTNAARLIKGIKTNFFFTTAAFAPIIL
jgi:hypothetical protein